MVNPGGTGIPNFPISAKLAPLPPNKFFGFLMFLIFLLLKLKVKLLKKYLCLFKIALNKLSQQNTRDKKIFLQLKIVKGLFMILKFVDLLKL